MISFKQFLSEAADSKQNLHLTHADEDLFERGDKGAKAAIEFVTDVLKNIGVGEVKTSTKWDGAPAVFAGWDPSDNKFFVGTKSVFNKTPKLYKTQSDIDANESGGKAVKLKFALDEFAKIGIPKGTVLQGDLLWTKGDQKYETIQGKRWITVHPNTLVYAWPADSVTGVSVAAANIGVVWHTTYKGGKDLQTYRASFGADVSKLKKSRTCWIDDASFKDAAIAFTEKEFDYAWTSVVAAKSLIGGFDKIVTVMDSLPGVAVGAGIKTFINSYIRKGKYPEPHKAYDEYVQYVKDYWEKKVVDAVKTESSKEQKRVQLKQFLNDLNAISAIVIKSFEYVEHITEAKMVIVKKLNALNKQAIFVKTKDGFKVTGHEGFVCFDNRKGEAVKFVDRLQFSHMNFSDEYLKGWMK
jgi:hypothetical protein